MTGPNPPDEPYYPPPGYSQQGYPPPGYPPQGYPPPGYAQQGYPSPPGPPGPGSALGGRLVQRASGRAQPRATIALAGAGVALVVVGVILWSDTYLAEGMVSSFDVNTGLSTGTSDSRRWLGVVLSLVVVATGCGLAIRWRSGPLSIAGVAASALGVPVLMGFASYSAPGGPSFDAIALVSLLAWIVSYLLVPGTRGHVFYLGLSALTLWIYVLDKVEPSGLSGIAASTAVPILRPSFGSSVDLSAITAVSLLFGLGYYAVMFVLDQRGRSGAGTAFALAGFVATVAGLVAGARDLKEAGTGVLLVVLGLSISIFAARSGRRFSTWIWAGAVAFGVALILGKIVGSGQNATLGALFVVFGAGLVVGAALLARALREPAEFATSPAGDVAG